MSQMIMVSGIRSEAPPTRESVVPIPILRTLLSCPVRGRGRPSLLLILAVGPLASISSSSFDERLILNRCDFCVGRRIRIAKSLRTHFVCLFLLWENCFGSRSIVLKISFHYTCEKTKLNGALEGRGSVDRNWRSERSCLL
jgi:hypothetical protein